MIQVRVAQQSAVSVRITGTAVVSAPEYAGPYDITPLFSAQTLPTAKRLCLAVLGKEFLNAFCLALLVVIPQVVQGVNSPINLHKASYRIIRCL